MSCENLPQPFISFVATCAVPSSQRSVASGKVMLVSALIRNALLPVLTQPIIDKDTTAKMSTLLNIIYLSY